MAMPSHPVDLTLRGSARSRASEAKVIDGANLFEPVPEPPLKPAEPRRTSLTLRLPSASNLFTVVKPAERKAPTIPPIRTLSQVTTHF